MRKLLPVLAGMKTFLPFCKKHFGTGGTDSGRYCYSVWLRHLATLRRHGMIEIPEVVAELGPGDSLGIGLSAMLSGAEYYYALDVVEHINRERNLEILEELVRLFETASPIPDDEEFPGVHPKLSSYAFDSELLRPEILKTSLGQDRVAGIRSTLTGLDRALANERTSIRYVCPWAHDENICDEAVDLIFSQAVLEHVDDLRGAYVAMHSWLKPGGYMSHQIDFGSHGITVEWNGHWTYPDFAWRLIRGRRPYLINREPLSTHLNLLEESGFDLLDVLTVEGRDGIPREGLTGKFRQLSEVDYRTTCAHIIARKRMTQA